MPYNTLIYNQTNVFFLTRRPQHLFQPIIDFWFYGNYLRVYPITRSCWFLLWFVLY